jgi:putative salt-induced outer membrane protein YdiY
MSLIGLLCLSVSAAPVEDELVKSLKPATAAEKKPWELTLAGGTALNSGNSDTRLTTASAIYQYKGALHELLFSADTAYGTDKGNANVDNSNGKANYHYRFSSPVYAVADASVTRDGIAALQYRGIASPGLGVYAIKRDDLSIGFEAGPGYLVERKGGVDNNAWTVRAAQRGEWQALATSKIWESVEYVPHLDDFNQYIVTAEAGVQSAITTLLNIRLVVKDAYDNAPAPGRKSNDVSILGALAIRL